MLIWRHGLSLSAGQEPYPCLIGQPTDNYLLVGEILVSASLTKVPEQSIDQKCLGEVSTKSALAKYRTQAVEYMRSYFPNVSKYPRHLIGITSKEESPKGS